MVSLREDSTLLNLARDTWTSADVVTGVGLNPFYDIHPFNTFAENNITSITPCTGMGGDEKLGRVGVGAPVGHRKQSSTIV